MYGTIWILIIVIVIQGNTTGVNISKAAIVQIGFDMEEAARVSGAGWFKTYMRIWIPLLLPTLALLAMMNFTIAAGTTSSIILLASRETTTMSILILQLLLPEEGSREAAAAAQIVLGVITLTLAFIARRYGVRLGVRHG
ncbi:MAG: ABC transporter permease subunit [Planctomycetes bacterium]|nr:ABC transporter permease subunit [Planctomycetota bacterium]